MIIPQAGKKPKIREKNVIRSGDVIRGR